MRPLTCLRFAALLIAILIVITGSHLPIYAQEATPSADAPPTFKVIQMINQTDGWAVVTVPDDDPFLNSDASPWQIYAGKLAYVLHTEDGGLSWANVTPEASKGLLPAGTYGCDCSDNGIAGFFFLDENHAWVMLNDAGFRGNQIFNGLSIHNTSDGGKTWQTHIIGDAPYVISSSFIDATHGWVLAGNAPAIDSPDQPALLYRTSDGAKWELIADDGVYSHPDGNPNAAAEPISPLETGIMPMNHTGMVFESESSGWMLTTYYDPALTELLHTTDGGMTWKAVNLLPDSTQVDDCNASDLKRSAPDQISFHASCYTEQATYDSSDNGKSWERNPLPDDMLNFDGSQLFMLTSTTGWAEGCDAPSSEYSCTAAPILYKTTDAGKTWGKIATLPDALNPVMLDNNLQYATFDFLDEATAWAIDRTGKLLTTNDGGKTWTVIETKIVLS